jgi:hypothetical protein
MPRLIERPTIVQAAGNKPKQIQEFAGRVNSGHSGVIDVRAGQAVVTAPGEWIRYSSPEADGAEYIAVCIPAFSPDTVHRDPG